MKAMLLTRLRRMEDDPAPLQAVELPDPIPAAGEILIQVNRCGVCHTELDEIEGRSAPPRLPVVPGHQLVGHVAGLGVEAGRFRLGDRVGVAWIFSACGKCRYCRRGEENLCPDFRATGRDANGGYAGFVVVSERFAHPIPDLFSDSEAAPLLCAGAVGYRSLRLAGLSDGQTLGLTGFGASAHLVLQMAKHLYPRSGIFVFARSEHEQRFAKEIGAAWAGGTGDAPPDMLDAAIDTTPAWSPVVAALRALRPGGRLVINAIRKEEADRHSLLELDYAAHLWMEKEIKTVANVTRRDVADFLELAARLPIRPEVQEYPLAQANQALMELKTRKIRGAKVLRVE
jgi:propanol-preferring alcohol dehydrogenase